MRRRKEPGGLLVHPLRPPNYLWIFRYSNGNKVVNWNNWMEGGPDGGEEENCASMKEDGKWNDKSCTIMLPFVCTKIKGE